MTREEQIKRYAVNNYIQKLPSWIHQPSHEALEYAKAIDKAFCDGAEWADNNPIIKDDEYIGMGFPEVQEYMESPRWSEVCFDADKNLWFVPKDMIK